MLTQCICMVLLRWCAPYAYKERKPLGCGGADKWPFEASAAFPGVRWEAGSGSIFCDAGFYCPNVTSQASCRPEFKPSTDCPIHREIFEGIDVNLFEGTLTDPRILNLI